MSLLPTNVMKVYNMMKFEFKIHILYLCLPVNINIFLTGKTIAKSWKKKYSNWKKKKKKAIYDNTIATQLLYSYHREEMCIKQTLAIVWLFERIWSIWIRM